MDDQQPVFKVVDRRPFNPDGTPRDLPAEEQGTTEPSSAAAPAEAQSAQQTTGASPATAPAPAPAPERSRPEPRTEPAASASRTAPESSFAGGDPLDDPASFLSLIMSLASNAAAALGMMPHPVTGETGIDLKTAKHWIDVLGMLEEKTRGNLSPQEEQVLESLLADLRMQYVSFAGSPTPPPAKFSASDITGGK